MKNKDWNCSLNLAGKSQRCYYIIILTLKSYDEEESLEYLNIVSSPSHF